MTICIVGHRDIREDQRQYVREEIERILRYFKTLDPELKTRSLIASGADTIFYEVAEALDIPIEIAFPFQQEIYIKDFEDVPLNLNKFKEIVNRQPKNITVLCPLKPNSTQKDRNEAYRKAGQLLVEESNYIIAVWDGQRARGIGGTADTVAHVWEKEKTLIHIKVDREADGKTAQDNFKGQDLNWLDEQARLAKNRFRNVWILGIALGLLSVIFYAPTLFFEGFYARHHNLKLALALLELIFLPLSYWLLRSVAPSAKYDFLSKRIAAERKRAYQEFKDIGLPSESKAPSEGKPSEKGHVAKEKLLKFVGQQISYHYHKRVKKYKHQSEIMHNILHIIVTAFFTVVLFNFIAELLEHFETDFAENGVFHSTVCWLHYFWVVLPASYAALEVITYFKEWQLNIRVSEKILLRLEAVKKDVIFSGTDSLEIQAQRFKNILEIENEDWNTLIDNKHIGPYI